MYLAHFYGRAAAGPSFSDRVLRTFTGTLTTVISYNNLKPYLYNVSAVQSQNLNPGQDTRAKQTRNGHNAETTHEHSRIHVRPTANPSRRQGEVLNPPRGGPPPPPLHPPPSPPSTPPPPRAPVCRAPPHTARPTSCAVGHRRGRCVLSIN